MKLKDEGEVKYQLCYQAYQICNAEIGYTVMSFQWFNGGIPLGKNHKTCYEIVRILSLKSKSFHVSNEKITVLAKQFSACYEMVNNLDFQRRIHTLKIKLVYCNSGLRRNVGTVAINTYRNARVNIICNTDLQV